MDITAITKQILAGVKKYRYVLLVLLLGIGLMLIPSKETQQSKSVSVPKEQEGSQDVTQPLINILGQIQGVGKVEVLLTYKASEETIYLLDEDSTTSSDGSVSVRKEAVLITDSDRSEQGLVSQVLPPKYLGAVVVCQGADDPAVRLTVAEAVAKATGLGLDRIAVSKMK